MTTDLYRFKLRRGTPAQWTQANPVLAAGEPGVELGTGQMKVGDGVTPWTQLGYVAPTEDELKSTIVDEVDGKLDQVFTVSRNLIDLDTIHLETVLDPADGSLRPGVTIRWTTDFIPVEPSTTYVISYDGTPITGGDVVLQRYAADGSTIGNQSNGGTSGTFATTGTTTHVRLSPLNEYLDAAQLEEGTVPTPYMPKGAREVVGVDDKINQRVPTAVEDYLTEHPPVGGGFVEDPAHPGYYLIGD